MIERLTPHPWTVLRAAARGSRTKSALWADPAVTHRVHIDAGDRATRELMAHGARRRPPVGHRHGSRSHDHRAPRPSPTRCCRSPALVAARYAAGRRRCGRPRRPSSRSCTCSVTRDVGRAGRRARRSMSASSPGSRRPRSSTSMSSADTVVAARIACSGVMPRSTSAISSLALRPCGIAGASVPHATFTPRSIALLIVLRGPREHLGRLGLQLGRGVRHVHAVGEVRGRDEERAALDHEVERLVARERAVLDAVDAGLDRGADAVVAVRVRRDLEPGAVRLVGDRRELLVASTAARRPGRCATSRRPTRTP